MDNYECSEEWHVLSANMGDGKCSKCGRKLTEYDLNFKYPNSMDSHKKASKMIQDLQNKNATLRLALGKLLRLCENTKMQDVSETWWHFMGVAKEAMHETDPNSKKNNS